MGRDLLIRRIKVAASWHVGHRALAALCVAALIVGAPSALADFGQFGRSAAPGIARRVSDVPLLMHLEHAPLRDFFAPLAGAPPPPVEDQIQPDDLLRGPPLGPAFVFIPPEDLTGPPTNSSMPAIAICVDDLGVELGGTVKAMALPREVTLSFLPYGRATPALARQSEHMGHEVLAHVPMEPVGRADPGPMVLKVGAADIAERLAWSLARVPGLSGINNHEGSKFSTDVASLMPVAQAMSARQLFFFDSRTIAGSQIVKVAHLYGVPSAGRDVFLDDELTDSAIEAQLNELAATARKTGVAIAIGHPHDITLRLLRAWLAEDHGVRLVPVSEAIRLKTRRATLIATR
jgi:uncharacterized protein